MGYSKYAEDNREIYSERMEDKENRISCYDITDCNLICRLAVRSSDESNAQSSQLLYGMRK